MSRDSTGGETAGFSVNLLGFRLSLVVIFTCILVGVTAALYLAESEQSRQLTRATEHLSLTGKKYAKSIATQLKDREVLAIAANQRVAEFLYPGNSANWVWNPGDDGSYRRDDGDSGAFVPSQSEHAKELGVLAEKSASLWQVLAPMVRQQFFNFYLIDKRSFIRIAPKDWALEIEADHDFSVDLFYRVATPEENPSRSAVWTPVYFDDIWKQWMTSLIVPVYKEDEFYGITGSDYVLDQLFAQVLTLAQIEPELNAFIFDQQGQLLAHPDFMQAIQSQHGDMNTTLSSTQLLPDAFATQLKAFAQMKYPAPIQAYQYDGKEQMVSITPIEGVNWYLGVYRSRADIMAPADRLKEQVLFGSVVLALLLSLLLQFGVYQLVLKRLNRLFDAVNLMRRGEFDGRLKTSGRDEISQLSQAFVAMRQQTKTLLDGLQLRIEEKDAAEQEAKKFSKAIAFSGSAVTITDAELVIEYVNPKFLQMTGMDKQEVLGQPLTIMFASSMSLVFDDMFAKLKKGRAWRSDILLNHTGDGHIWVQQTISPIRDNTGSVTHYVSSAQDITFIKESQREMERLAFFDPLTGLANRSYFKLQLQKVIAICQRGHAKAALFYLDLDEFKRINDTLGHDAGDELLRRTASRLKKRLRAEDTVARLGGDEFAILINSFKTQSELITIAEAIRHEVTLPVNLNNREVIVSTSIGIACVPEDGDEQDTLMKRADLAMYQAKSMGRDNYQFYQKALDEAAQEQLELESYLRQALSNNELVLYYQPKVCLGTGRIVGVEALLRWQHPVMGFVGPDRFIPVAERSGLIITIGTWVLDQACAFIKRMHKIGHTELQVAINLSARQFEQKDLPKMLKKLIEFYDLDASAIELEITESMIMGDVNAAEEQLNELRQLGLSLSIDDFGTGHSSLSYLKRFPIHALKIDRSFVRDIPQDSNDVAITAAVLAMAQKLNVEVVAEGIETKPQAEFLRENHCQLGQGYLFSRPIPEAELIELLNKVQTLSA